MRQTLFILSTVFSLGLLFNSCKKYPENNLWLKNPNKVLERGASIPWLLEYYSVNDIDSTNNSFLSVFKELGVVVGDKNSSYGFYCDGIIQGGYSLKDRKKSIQFFYGDFNFHTNSIANPNYQNQRNIFLDDELHWEINKLTKQQFWIIGTFNNVKYEIHFK